MQKLKKQGPHKKTGVLLLWKRGEEDSYLENVDVKILQDGIVQIQNKAKDEKITTHVSNVIIVE